MDEWLYIPVFFVDVIIYTCLNPEIGLGNPLTPIPTHTHGLLQYRKSNRSSYQTREISVVYVKRNSIANALKLRLFCIEALLSWRN